MGKLIRKNLHPTFGALTLPSEDRRQTITVAGLPVKAGDHEAANRAIQSQIAAETAAERKRRALAVANLPQIRSVSLTEMEAGQRRKLAIDRLKQALENQTMRGYLLDGLTVGINSSSLGNQNTAAYTRAGVAETNADIYNTALSLAFPVMYTPFYMSMAGRLAGPEGVLKTWNHAKNGEYIEAAASGMGDALDLLSIAPGVTKSTREVYDLTKKGWNRARNFSRNNSRFSINPDGISLAPQSTDNISKGLQERENFINWLDSNPEVDFIGTGQVSPELLQNSWKNHAGEILEVTINPNGRVGTYLLYLLNRFGLKPLNKVGIGSSNNFELHVGGWYNHGTGKARVSVNNTEDFVPRIVHEVGGHSTESGVMSKPISDFTNQKVPKITGFNGMIDFLRSSPTEIFGRDIKTVEDVYGKLANIKMSLTKLPKFYKNNKRFTMPLNSEDSRLAEEARATFKLLQELKLKEFGYNLQKYNEYIDNMTLEDIMELLGKANGYGLDYRNNLKYASSKDKELWLNLAKFTLKYLPASVPIAIGLSETSNK